MRGQRPISRFSDRRRRLESGSSGFQLHWLVPSFVGMERLLLPLLDSGSLVLYRLDSIRRLSSYLNIVASVQGFPRSDEHLRHSCHHSHSPQETHRAPAAGLRSWAKSWLAKRRPRRSSGGCRRLVSSSGRETCSRQQEQERTTRFARVYYFALSCFNNFFQYVLCYICCKDFDPKPQRIFFFV